MLQSPVEEGQLEERSLRELIGQLSRDGSLLLRQEVALAKQELSEIASKLKRDMASVAVGGFVCHLGALTLTAALVLLLAQVMSAWVAAVVVGVLLSAAGAVLLQRGAKNLQQLELKPEKTRESVRQDIQAVKEAAQ